MILAMQIDYKIRREWPGKLIILALGLALIAFAPSQFPDSQEIRWIESVVRKADYDCYQSGAGGKYGGTSSPAIRVNIDLGVDHFSIIESLFDHCDDRAAVMALPYVQAVRNPAQNVKIAYDLRDCDPKPRSLTAPVDWKCRLAGLIDTNGQEVISLENAQGRKLNIALGFFASGLLFILLVLGDCIGLYEMKSKGRGTSFTWHGWKNRR